MINALYRGKHADNGEWVYGNIVLTKDKAYILPDIADFTYGDNGNRIRIGCFVEVNTETVGQWTGLTDNNGIKIFYGDIVCTRYSNGKICCIGDVQFCYGVYGAEWIEDKNEKSMVGNWGQLHNLRRFDDDIINHIEIIGNIHDNPDLLVKS